MSKILPTTLFSRLVLIILVPMLLVQIVTILVFFERHWDTVTGYMSNNLAAEMQVVVDRYADNPTPSNFAEVKDYAWSYFQFHINWQAGEVITATGTPSIEAEEALHESLARRIEIPFAYDLFSDPNQIAVMVQFSDGVMTIKASRKRIFSSTSFLVILWTVSTSVLLFLVALIFVRGQVRPIIRLAKASRQLGLGRPVDDFKLEGAREVRLAGTAFKAMCQRIMKQMVERTEMLAGVSHDLRTPLTRMKLHLQYLPEGDERAGIERDITEMETMINDYIDFASNAVIEDMVESDLVKIIKKSVKATAGGGEHVDLIIPQEPLPLISLRSRSIRRTIDNIISNALRFGNRCTVTLERHDNQIQIIVDDDGIGIPKDKRVDVLRPFVRLDSENKSEGAGLGLSIANDTVLAHGGVLLLGDSPMGGLRVRILLSL